MINELFIYGGDEDLYLDTKLPQYTYHINTGNIIGENNISINNSIIFLEISKNFRDEYAEYIYSLNKLFLGNGLLYNNDISYYFFTDLSNKRTEIYDTYQSICHLHIIREKLKNNNMIKKIIVNQVSERFLEAIKSTFGNTYKVSSYNINKEKSGQLKFHLKQILFFIKTAFFIIILKFVGLNKNLPTKFKSLFFTRYPKHFNNTKLDGKYGNYFQQNDYYLISIISDGFHQNVQLTQFVKYLIELKRAPFNYILLDNYLSLSDVIKSLFTSFKLFYASVHVRNSEFNFKGINFSDYAKMELNTSLLRIPRLIMYESSMKKVLRDCNIEKFIYYLFEFSYGRYFTYLLKKYSPHTITCGFQHGPNSQRHIMFFLAQNEPATKNHSYKDHLPIPDEIIAENNYSKKVYEDGNYINIKLMKGIYRLRYLKNVKRDEVIPNTVLIAAAMHDGSQLFTHLKEEMIKNLSIKYYFKFHPRSMQYIEKINKLNKPNIIAATESLIYYLSFVSKVIVTQSSVGYEAYTLGIPVRVVSLPNKINDSPLLDIVENEKSKNITVDYMLS